MISDRAGIIACYFLAFASLVAAIYHVQVLLPLLENGKHTEAVVVDIRSGAKGSKNAIYQFTTDTGQQKTYRDIFQMYIIRLHKGDQVTVIYDPLDASKVTADLGGWIWQGPIIFFSGFIFLATLGILILRFKPKTDANTISK